MRPRDGRRRKRRRIRSATLRWGIVEPTAPLPPFSRGGGGKSRAMAFRRRSTLDLRGGGRARRRPTNVGRHGLPRGGGEEGIPPASQAGAAGRAGRARRGERRAVQRPYTRRGPRGEGGRLCIALHRRREPGRGAVDSASFPRGPGLSGTRGPGPGSRLPGSSGNGSSGPEPGDRSPRRAPTPRARPLDRGSRRQPQIFCLAMGSGPSSTGSNPQSR